MKIMFIGHEDFSNRGCEALVRSISTIVGDIDPSVEFLLPSKDSVTDQDRWPQCGSQNIRFVASTPFRRMLNIWGRVLNYAPGLVRFGAPPFSLLPDAKRAMAEADAFIVTGGDIFSLEYGRPSLFFWTGQVDAALKLGKPVHLWAASVGPFTADPVIERMMVSHLKKYASISVRESATFDYLQRMGVPGVRYVADPAFVMAPEPHEHADALFKQAEDGVLGFNVSPLVRRSLEGEAQARFDGEIVDFLRHVIDTTGLSVLLVPHVDPFDGSARNSDSIYMGKLLADAQLPDGRLAILPNNLNAAQLKYALGRCRFFIGARTHATIGAMSQGVPTISIAYSVKAVGINRDLFGDEEVVLPTPQVSKVTLIAALTRLFTREDTIRAILTERIPIWRARAREAAEPIVDKRAT